MSNWINAEGTKPKTGQIVDVWVKHGKKGMRLVNLRWMSSLEVFRSLSTGINYKIGDRVTHWMPLPEPPTE